MTKLYLFFKSLWIGDKVTEEGFSFNWNVLIIVVLIILSIGIYAWFSEKKAKKRREKWKKVINKKKTER
tara:strand:- start:875 stop:1081 length:207 start_codon:yes stop_codon:yes gene_type:complete